MISLALRPLLAGLAAALALAGPAAADPLVVTTSETDSGQPFYGVVIVDPLDGFTTEGTPDAVIPVMIEFYAFTGDLVGLKVDDLAVPGDCTDQFGQCTIMVTLTPGVHTLVATGNADGQSPGEPVLSSDPVTVEVTTSGETTDATTGGSSGGDPTSSGSGGSGSSGSGETDTSGSSGSTDGSSGSGAGGPVYDDQGCACAASASPPDLLSLGLLGLLAPWRRRRVRR